MADAAKLEAMGRTPAPTPEGWEEDQVGFPPYWKPENVGDWFRGKIMLLDERDPEFRRYVVEATDEILCAKGPAEGADTILVLPGELFTVNDYSALPLERYFGWEVIAIADKKRKLAASVKPDAKDYQKRSRDLWDWRVKVPPELKALLKSQRDESAKMLADRRAEARAKALQAMADSSATNNF